MTIALTGGGLVFGVVEGGGDDCFGGHGLVFSGSDNYFGGQPLDIALAGGGLVFGSNGSIYHCFDWQYPLFFVLAVTHIIVLACGSFIYLKYISRCIVI